MARARQSFLSLVASVSVAGWAGSQAAASPASPASPSSPAGAVAAPFSPSKVLTQIGERKGNVSYASFGQQGSAPTTIAAWRRT